MRAILAKPAVVREIEIAPGMETSVLPDRLRGLAREGRLSPTSLIERCTVTRRRAIVVALLIDLEARLSMPGRVSARGSGYLGTTSGSTRTKSGALGQVSRRQPSLAAVPQWRPSADRHYHSS